MRAHIKVLYITVGLPASGKTTWAKSMVRDDWNVNHIELDSLRYKSGLDNVLRSYIRGGMSIIDGLILTEDDIVKILNILTEEKIKVDKVKIHYWKPDREVCMWNDLYRRDVDSGITISNAVIDDFKNTKNLKSQFPDINFEIVKHDIVRAEPYVLFANKHNLYMDEFGNVKGDSWCTGGTWANCWGDSGTVGPDSKPDDMRILDEILEEVAPNISFLQYKKIKGNCVTTETYSDGDYYGGTTYHQQYVLDVKYLYNYLIELEIIEPIE